MEMKKSIKTSQPKSSLETSSSSRSKSGTLTELERKHLLAAVRKELNEEANEDEQVEGLTIKSIEDVEGAPNEHWVKVEFLCDGGGFKFNVKRTFYSERSPEGKFS